MIAHAEPVELWRVALIREDGSVGKWRDVPVACSNSTEAMVRFFESRRKGLLSRLKGKTMRLAIAAPGCPKWWNGVPFKTDVLTIAIG